MVGLAKILRLSFLTLAARVTPIERVVELSRTKLLKKSADIVFRAMLDDKAVLEQRSSSLRKELKAWEKQFSKANGGKKPAHEDIKADADIGELVERRTDTIIGSDVSHSI